MRKFKERKIHSSSKAIRIFGCASAILVCVIVQLIFLVVGGVLILVLMFVFASPKPPSDKQLIEQYRENITEFEQLAKMFAAEDELLLVYPGERQCESVERERVEGEDNAKCDEYVRIFNHLNLGWAYINDDRVNLRVYTSGITGHGLRKGFLYTKDLTNLEGVFLEDTGTRGEPMPRYNHIDGTWYIFFE